jgi:hypothetical protein
VLPVLNDRPTFFESRILVQQLGQPRNGAGDTSGFIAGQVF